MYAFSTNSEHYHCHVLNSFREAIDEALKETGDGDFFYVGEVVKPTPPEDLWSVEDWIEHVSCQDDYSGDFADGWFNATKDQVEELEGFVKAIMTHWLDKHKLRPTHYNIPNSVKYQNIDGVALLIGPC